MCFAKTDFRKPFSRVVLKISASNGLNDDPITVSTSCLQNFSLYEK